jgi:hypothetical protein
LWINVGRENRVLLDFCGNSAALTALRAFDVSEVPGGELQSVQENAAGLGIELAGLDFARGLDDGAMDTGLGVQERHGGALADAAIVQRLMVETVRMATHGGRAAPATIGMGVLADGCGHDHQDPSSVFCKWTNGISSLRKIDLKAAMARAGYGQD